MRKSYHLALFNTKNKVVSFYSALEDIGYKSFTLVSAPCSIKFGCNYAIMFVNKAHIDTIIKESKKLGIELPEIYFVNNASGKYEYKRISI